MKELLISRKFWAAAAALIAVTASGFITNLPDAQPLLADLAVLTASYILGTGLEANPAPAGQVLISLLRSRKFWAAAAGVMAVSIKVLLPDLPVEESQLHAVIVTLAAYIVGTGIQDRSARERNAR